MTSRVMRILLIFGTRPEAIKLYPVLVRLKGLAEFETTVCVTAQHRDLLDQTLAALSVAPDYDLDVMVQDQSLFHITQATIARIEPVLSEVRPELVIVQGDAHTTFAGALAAFYARVPVAHVEAGLRTNDKSAPFPEEMNRRLVDQLSDVHFAPTMRARSNLIAEGIDEAGIFVTGNTEIDTLYLARETLRPQEEFAFPGHVVLVTLHRRENFGDALQRVCAALVRIADRNEDVTIVLPVHPNPHVKDPIHRALGGHRRIVLLDPVDYVSFVHLMAGASLILTDSGGVQEAAAALHVPLLVLRDKTERMEGVNTGAARIVGRDADAIVATTELLLRDQAVYRMMKSAENPYGDGAAAVRIVNVIKEKFL